MAQKPDWAGRQRVTPQLTDAARRKERGRARRAWPLQDGFHESRELGFVQSAIRSNAAAQVNAPRLNLLYRVADIFRIQPAGEK